MRLKMFKLTFKKTQKDQRLKPQKQEKRWRILKMNWPKSRYLTVLLLVGVQACASSTKNDNTAPPSTYVREVQLLEPQDGDMLNAPKSLDLSKLPDDITFEQSIDLNKICIVSHKELETAKRDWISFYRYLKQLNPEPITEPEAPEAP